MITRAETGSQTGSYRIIIEHNGTQSIMSIKKWIYLKKTDFLCRYHKGGAAGVKEALFSALNMSADELEELNFRRFKEMLRHAYDNSDYYHEKYVKAGLEPDDIKSPDDIGKIPLMTRAEIKENRERILCRGVNRKSVFLTSTGGSTGNPLFFYHENSEPYFYLKHRFLQTLGIEPDANGAMVIRRNNTFVNRLKNGIWNWPAKRLNLNAMMITPESLYKFLRQAKSANLQFLWGYEGGIHHVALFLKKHNIEFPTQLKAVISTSSPLPDAHRALFKQIFHCDVYDQYGSCEVQWLGTECPHHHGLHVPWDIRRIEIVDGNGKELPHNEYGDIIVTDLLNFSFPFIRYRNGDRGRMLDNCCPKCEIPFPLLDSVKGRITDLIKFDDGSCIAGDYLTTIFDAYPMAVDAFQVVQKKNGDVELHYVPSARPESEEEIQKVVTNLQKLIGNRAAVCGKAVSEIKHDRGKNRFVISER